MAYYIVKILVTTLLIMTISEIAKRSSLIGGILASIPIVSVLAMIWIYVDTKNTEKVSELSVSVFWLVIPSLALFVTLPVFLKKGFGFYPSMGLAIIITVVCYYLMIGAFGKFGIKL